MPSLRILIVLTLAFLHMNSAAMPAPQPLLFQAESAPTRQEICAECYEFESEDICSRALQVKSIAGNLQWAAHYNAFGRASIVTPAPTANAPTINLALRLPGQYEDPETGLHYNFRRYYDPETGRYWTQDPIGLEGGINQYGYAQADPINLTDPTGEIVPLAVAAATCMAGCMASTAAEDLLTGECTSIGTNAKNCAIGCAMGGIGMLAMKAHKAGKWAKKATDCGNSFAADTLVHIQPQEENEQAAQAGNTQLKRIQDLQPGDKVLAFAEWKDSGTEKGQDQRLSYEPITDIFTSHRAQTHIFLSLDNGQTLQTTAGHPFLTSEGWRDAILLKRGGKLLIKGEDEPAAKLLLPQAGEDRGEGAGAILHKPNQPVAGINTAQSAIESIVNVSQSSDVSQGSQRYASILDISVERQTVQVFNIEVANAHTFFVGDEGVLVHNGGGCKKSFDSMRAAFRAAKRDAKIPTSQTHTTHTRGQGDRTGSNATDFKFPGNKEVQSHPNGLPWPSTNGSNQPHFNNHQPAGVPGGTKNHYTY